MSSLSASEPRNVSPRNSGGQGQLLRLTEALALLLSMVLEITLAELPESIYRPPPRFYEMATTAAQMGRIRFQYA